ncbi:MAG: Mur ligase [Lysobacterales bacterium]|nr:MAG: Mur ligase [Xanthomonadales bacterium]
MLETVGPADEAVLAGWRDRIVRGRRRLGWPSDAPVVARGHGAGTVLAIAAGYDQLFTAAELNEWAWCATLCERDPRRTADIEAALAAAAEESPGGFASRVPPVLDEAAALERLATLAREEARPALRAVVDAAEARGLPWFLDDDTLSIGAGAGAHGAGLGALPAPADWPWPALHDIPTALVTGSNGKTTVVRLIAACAKAAGRRPGLSCTDGLFVDGEILDAGDYSGPLGARTILRDPHVEAAVLETARGGILRRGLAVRRARAAVVTNISADHFGEYGIHDLDGLADAKLTVGHAVGAQGLLVLNADDPTLVAKSGALAQRYGIEPHIGWFALDAERPLLREHRRRGGSTCGMHDNHLVLAHEGVGHLLGSIAGFPVTVDGRARYNVANLAAAALAATALGIPPAAIAAAFAAFGSRPADNPGRMMRYEIDGVHVLVDYAHNPAGLAGVLEVARGLKHRDARLGLTLGHAGNREDADLVRVSAVAAGFRPDLVVVKETEGYLRGREPGEVPRIMRSALRAHGLAESALPVEPTEVDAARHLLDWARPGDVVVLLIHSRDGRAAVLEMLGARGSAGG